MFFRALKDFASNDVGVGAAFVTADDECEADVFVTADVARVAAVFAVSDDVSLADAFMTADDDFKFATADDLSPVVVSLMLRMRLERTLGES